MSALPDLPEDELGKALYSEIRRQVSQKLYGKDSIADVHVSPDNALSERMYYEMKVAQRWAALRNIITRILQLIAIGGLFLIVRVLVIPSKEFLWFYEWAAANRGQGAICIPFGLILVCLIFAFLEAVSRGE